MQSWLNRWLLGKMYCRNTSRVVPSVDSQMWLLHLYFFILCLDCYIMNHNLITGIHMIKRASFYLNWSVMWKEPVVIRDNIVLLSLTIIYHILVYMYNQGGLGRDKKMTLIFLNAGSITCGKSRCKRITWSLVWYILRMSLNQRSCILSTNVTFLSFFVGIQYKH